MDKNQIKLGITSIQRSVVVCNRLGLFEAASAAVYSMIDAINALVEGNEETAAEDCFKSSFLIYKVLYESFSEKFEKRSSLAEDAEKILKESNDWNAFAKASSNYMDAIAEVVHGTEFEAEFLKFKVGS